MSGDEVRALRELRRQFPVSTFVFATERGDPFTPDAVNRLIKRLGERAGFAFPVHAHMLRHACRYALANAGHDTRSHSGLARPSIHPAHDALHAIERGAVQGLLEVGGASLQGREADLKVMRLFSSDGLILLSTFLGRFNHRLPPKCRNVRDPQHQR